MLETIWRNKLAVIEWSEELLESYHTDRRGKGQIAWDYYLELDLVAELLVGEADQTVVRR